MSETAGDWLRRNGLEQLEEVFKRERITVDLFVDLTEADLADLGLTIGDRKVFMRALRNDPSRGSPPAPTGAAPANTVQMAERRVLTIAFIDLVGSTAISTRIDAEELHE